MYLLIVSLFLYFGNVEAIRASKNVGYLTNWGRVYGIFKWINEAEWLNPT
jgi:hypothetical protein